MELTELMIAGLLLIVAVTLLMFCTATVVLNLKCTNMKKLPIAEHFPVDSSSPVVKYHNSSLYRKTAIGGIPDVPHICMRYEAKCYF